MYCSNLAPDSATASTVTPSWWAMNPRTEKTTNPATKLVPLFSRQSQKQSLVDAIGTVAMIPLIKFFFFFLMQTYRIELYWIVSKVDYLCLWKWWLDKLLPTNQKPALTRYPKWNVPSMSRQQPSFVQMMLVLIVTSCWCFRLGLLSVNPWASPCF